jgi:hypothetical protein
VGEDNRVGCTGHITHLGVHDFLGAYRLSAADPVAADVIDKVRGIARGFRASPTWSEELEAQQRMASAQPLAYKIDAETRWDSLHDMLERAVAVNEASRKRCRHAAWCSTWPRSS